MFSSNQPNPDHHVRFYIIMATLVIGGIFFFLLVNNDDGSVTNAIGKAIDSTPLKLSDDATAATTAASSGKVIVKDANLVSVKLDVDKTISFKKKITADDITVKFRDVENQITVNNDRLELHNLNTVELKISGFSGEASVDPLGLALDGMVRRIEVNGVVLASAKEIKVSFSKIFYDYADFDRLVISDLSTTSANGKITISDRLNYELSEDSFTISNVEGRLTFDLSGAAGTTFSGTARGLDFSGSSLNLQVR